MVKVDALAMFEVITVTQGSNQKILQSGGLHLSYKTVSKNKQTQMS